MIKVTINMTREELNELGEEYENEDMEDTSFTELAWSIAEKVLMSVEVREVD